MRVIFLDIDGVLNSVSSFIYNNRLNLLGLSDILTHQSLCPIACSNLQYILEEVPDLKVVITSTWRKYHSLDELRNMFSKNTISSEKVIDATPAVSRYRGEEIESFLNIHPEVTEFVILDDDTDMKPYRHRLVKTDSRNGLTFVDAENVIKMFGETNEEVQ